MNTKAKKEKLIEDEAADANDFYLSEDAKSWDFSDYVRVTSGPRGMVFSFGKFVRDNNKYGIFKEIILPYDVVESLVKIIQGQFDQLLRDGLLKKIENESEQ